MLKIHNCTLNTSLQNTASLTKELNHEPLILSLSITYSLQFSLHLRHHAFSFPLPSMLPSPHRILIPLHRRNSHENVPKMHEPPNPTSLHSMDIPPSQLNLGTRLLRKLHITFWVGWMGHKPHITGNDRNTCINSFPRPKLRPNSSSTLHIRPHSEAPKSSTALSPS